MDGQFEHPDLREAFSLLPGKAPERLFRGCLVVDLAPSAPPWTDTGIELKPGDWVTTLAVGRAYLSRALDIWVGPHFQLWMRVGLKGTIFRGTRNTHSFFAFESGRLFLASYLPGEWASQRGALATPQDVYGRVSGRLSVGIILWNGPTLKGLKQIEGLGEAQKLVEREIDRIRSAAEPPDGWQYHWLVGPAEIFRRCSDHGWPNAICCETREDAGILHKDVRVALTPGIRLRWEWLVDQLPSHLREDTAATHDYLGIAIELDDGRDLSYLWSAALPFETAFRCPFKTRQAREALVVVRSGPSQLGRWLTEERNVYADCIKTMPGPLPGRIVRVWLVAASLLQRKQGRAHFGAICLVGPDGVVHVN